MATRSRKGCIDCKQAKVKCDEVHPACGTCARRSRKCRGYVDTTARKPESFASADLFQPFAQMPCAPSPRRGGSAAYRVHSRSNSNSSSLRHNTALYMPYARPPQPLRAMSPPEPIPAAGGSAAGAGHAGLADPSGSMTSLPADLLPMDQMAQMPHMESMASLSAMPSTGMGTGMGMAPMHGMQALQDLQTMQNMPSMPSMPTMPTMPSIPSVPNMPPIPSLPTMLPFGVMPPPPGTIADPAPDLSWVPVNWPEKINGPDPPTSVPFMDATSYNAHPYPEPTLYPDLYDTSLNINIPDMTVFPSHPINNDEGIDAEFISPGAAAAHAAGASVVTTSASSSSSSSPPYSLIAQHQTHTFPNGRPLVGPDKRRLIGPAAAARSRAPVLDVSGLWSPPVPAPVRGPSFIPLNEIVAADKTFIEMYFLRHPVEMVMSSKFFINEMNGTVLSLLQVSPIVVGESLCVIGENYAKDKASYDSSRALGQGDSKNNKGGSSPEDAGTGSSGTPTAGAVSNRKTKLLRRLRLLKEDGGSPELVLLLLLALCAAELTSPNSDGKGSNLTYLIENVAMVLDFHARSGRELSTTAKYFAKGVARQDLLRSLSRMQRPKIQPATWLDDYESRHADRLLGLTATLTPILYKLAELAGDVQAILDASQADQAASADGSGVPFYGDSIDGMPPMASGDAYCFFADESSVPDASLYLTRHSNLAEREASLRTQLLMWRPVHDYSLSIQTSRNLMLHASAWRAAALLYLFRLFNRPGSSPDADRTALGMAYEVMMHIHGPSQDVKLSLWPLFVAACELQQPEDRALATALLSEVCHARPIMTARRTKELVMEHIWPARDRGDVWDWMQLTANNVFMPL